MDSYSFNQDNVRESGTKDGASKIRATVPPLTTVLNKTDDGIGGASCTRVNTVILSVLYKLDR